MKTDLFSPVATAEFSKCAGILSATLSQLHLLGFQIDLKKVGKTTRPFRYDLNQIPYDYVVEVKNRFKGINLVECLMNSGRRFMTLYRRQGSRPLP